MDAASPRILAPNGGVIAYQGVIIDMDIPYLVPRVRSPVFHAYADPVVIVDDIVEYPDVLRNVTVLGSNANTPLQASGNVVCGNISALVITLFETVITNVVFPAQEGDFPKIAF